MQSIRVPGFPCLLYVSCFVLALTGCVAVFDFPPDPVTTYAQRDKINLNVGLRLTDEFCNYIWEAKRGAPFKLALGTSLCSNAENVARAAFREVRIIREAAGGVKPESSAVLTPRITSIERSLPMVAWQMVEMVINLEWALTDPQGQTVWINTIKGVGRETMGSAFTFGGQTRKQVQLALEDVFSKTFAELVASPEIKEFAATRSP